MRKHFHTFPKVLAQVTEWESKGFFAYWYKDPEGSGYYAVKVFKEVDIPRTIIRS